MKRIVLLMLIPMLWTLNEYTQAYRRPNPTLPIRYISNQINGHL